MSAAETALVLGSAKKKTATVPTSFVMVEVSTVPTHVSGEPRVVIGTVDGATTPTTVTVDINSSPRVGDRLLVMRVGTTSYSVMTVIAGP